MKTTKKYGYITNTKVDIALSIASAIILLMTVVLGSALFNFQMAQARLSNQYDVRNINREHMNWVVNEYEGKYYFGDDRGLVEGKTIEEAIIKFNQKYYGR